MRCHYEVLGVEFDVSAGDLKTAYRKLALKLHPDKNQGVEDAQAKFQELQSAYETLSDPQERAWYDDHRDQILHVGTDGDSSDGYNPLPNIWVFFGKTLGKSFDKKQVANFYEEFDSLFFEIDTELPRFGMRESLEACKEFYLHWEGFSSKLSFAWADKYFEIPKGESRQVRRAVKQENDRARKKAKKDWNIAVRKLVSHVKKYDLRLQDLKDLAAKNVVSKPKLVKSEKEKQRARDLIQKNFEEEFERRKAENHFVLADEPVIAETNKPHDPFEFGSYTPLDERETSPIDTSQPAPAKSLNCDTCKKSFKSDKSLEDHLQSKKHRQAEKQLKKLQQKLQQPSSEEKTAPKKRRNKNKTKPFDLKCSTCNATFEARNQLFKHIEAEGHARLK